MCLTSVVSDAAHPSRKLCILLLDLWYASTFRTAELEQAARGMGGASSLPHSFSLSLSFLLFSLSSHFFQIGHFSFPLFPYWKNLLSASSYCVHRPIPVLCFFSPHTWKKVQTDLIFRPSDVLYSRFGYFTAASYCRYFWTWVNSVCPLSPSQEIKNWCIILPGTHCVLTVLIQQR